MKWYRSISVVGRAAAGVLFVALAVQNLTYRSGSTGFAVADIIGAVVMFALVAWSVAAGKAGG